MIENEIANFKKYCTEKYGSRTGTAVSYTNAIKYLFEYLHMENIDNESVLELRSIETNIRNTNSSLYKDILEFFVTRGQSSYIEKGFLKAAIPVLYEYLKTQTSLSQSDNIILEELKDSQIDARFNQDILKNEFPVADKILHDYTLRRINGTTQLAVKRIVSGRKSEKYFISFLTDILNFEPNIDFIDVANNKNYGYDIWFHNIGLEIKNIGSGTFYLTDNEIAQLESKQTHLIFVDVNNGIWLLKNSSPWLKKIIDDIKSIRKICTDNYDNLDLSDIRIITDDALKQQVHNLLKKSKNEFTELIGCRGGN